MQEIQGTPEISQLANALSDTFAAAVRAGMSPDIAIGVMAAVLADYGRGYFGERYLEDIADIVRARGRFDMPQEVGVQ